MKYLLDTNICIYAIRKKPPPVLDRLRRQQVGDVGISSITLSELLYGVEKSANPEKNLKALHAFTMPLVILPFGPKSAVHYGRIRAHLERNGTPIGPLDTLIAAHALSVDATLATSNKKGFDRVPGLRTDDWAK